MFTKKQFNVLLILLVVAVGLTYAYQTLRPTSELDGPYAVERVVDGDTIVVDIGDDSIKIRLIGIDTPESVHSNSDKNTQEGLEASEYTKGLLSSKKVYLDYDVEREDRYGRTLAYVYLDDKKTMVNQLLVEEGYAMVMTIQPNSQYADVFYNAQQKARADKKGFWETGFFSDED